MTSDKPWLTIGCGSTHYTQAEAEEVLAGFAFGTVGLAWKSPPVVAGDDGLAAPPRAARRSNWSYRTYDCVPNSTYAFEVSDLLAVAALDAGAGSAAFLAVEAIIPDLNEALAHIEISQTFWTLDPALLGLEPPRGISAEWWLWRAWALLMGLDRVRVAITYKTLHHKRPWFFPIFDNDTVAVMRKCGASWQTLHEELTTQVHQFEYLEQWFAGQAVKRGGVPLTRLRIHDILLWGDAQRGPLGKAGRDILGS